MQLAVSSTVAGSECAHRPQPVLSRCVLWYHPHLCGVPWAQTCFKVSVAMCVACAQVRRGDKATESPEMLMDDAPFFEHAAALQAAFPDLSKTILLTTEDDKTLAYFKTKAPEWTVLYTDVARYSAGVRSSMQHALEIGVHVEVLNSLVALDITLHGGAFVGALISNWPRLIDELRATVACRANAPLVDPEQPSRIDQLRWL